MEIEADSSVSDIFKFPSSDVTKTEPLMDCPEDGTGSHLVRHQHLHADFVMTHRDVKDESTTSVLNNVMEQHQGYQQSTNVHIKQEPPDADWKYPTPLTSVKGQIAAIHENLSHTDDGIKLEQTSLPDGIGMCTNTTIGKITAGLDHVENLKFEGYGIDCPSPDISDAKPPVPVVLYRRQTEAMTFACNQDMAGEKLESPLPVETHCPGTHVDVTYAHWPTEDKAYCKYGSTSEPTRASHVRQIDEKTFKCTLCDYRSVCNSNLVRHMKTHRRGKPFACSLCDYRSVCNSNLGRHMKTHTRGKPVKCSVFDYSSASNSSLVTHMRTHAGDKRFTCSICDYRPARNSDLVRHMKTHTGEKPFSCSMCHYRSVRNSSLVTHMRRHTGEKPFRCSMCDYRSIRHSSLVTHMRTHTGEKPFRCSMCDYKSVSNSNLVRHMRTHAGGNPFRCLMCNYRFISNNNLIKHMKTHTDKKPFKCSVCDYRSPSCSNLFSHMQTHTGE